MKKYEIHIKTANRFFMINRRSVRSPLKMIINETELNYIKNRIKIEGLLEHEYTIEEYVSEPKPIKIEESLIVEKIKEPEKKVKVEKNSEQSKNRETKKKKRGRPSKKTTLEKLLEE